MLIAKVHFCFSSPDILSGSYPSFNIKVEVRLSHKFYGKKNSFPWEKIWKSFRIDVRVLGVVFLVLDGFWCFCLVLVGWGFFGCWLYPFASENCSNLV